MTYPNELEIVEWLDDLHVIVRAVCDDGKNRYQKTMVLKAIAWSEIRRV